jgi:hypothetical protein
MNEQLFIPKVDALQLARAAVSKVEESTLARHVLAFSAALAVNLAVLATLQRSAATAGYAPPGEVVITQLEALVEVRVAQN